ncbi:efflux RND transporter periplasmic adaptor subunit [Stieleria varia]|uniref:Multidrug resistance protein MdtA n=1 Tax=Stieleria varia TaxID=2528005 RepID=A0A5C6B0M1_9BACT|nr:efflux RND transporter periplasmic adaptor subunit [Stieleria varia]TWU04942.1 Multidrug resistance protein MdtA precursor [Stieleria varia]
MSDSSSSESNAKRRRPWASYLVGSIALLLVGGASYAGYKLYSQSDTSQQAHSRPPTSVTVASAQRQTWTTELTGVGTLTAVQGTELTSELAGKVVAIDFESGARVEQGELLVQLDTTSEVAQLESLEPQLRKAKSDQERATQLIEGNAISREAYDEAIAEVDRLQAAIDKQRAIIDRKKIVAPFAGTLGIRKTNLGQYVSPGDAVVNLQQIEPIFVDFDLPERNSGVVDLGIAVRVSTSAYPDARFIGNVSAITPLIQETTRSFTVRAELPNQERKLKPGMFADVVVELPQQRDVVTIPQTAIAVNAYGSSVFVLQEAEQGSEQTLAKRTFVRTGERRGLDIEIIEGVEAGQRVVTSGQLKLSNESPVTISQRDVSEGVVAEPTKP